MSPGGSGARSSDTSGRSKTRCPAFRGSAASSSKFKPLSTTYGRGVWADRLTCIGRDRGLTLAPTRTAAYRKPERASRRRSEKQPDVARRELGGEPHDRGHVLLELEIGRAHV